MNIVIVGDGKVGSALSEQLSREGHNVTIIDNRSQPLQRSSEVMDVMTVEGNGAVRAVQIEAGVPDADIFIAATSTDETNMLSCFLANRLGVKNTIARIRNPEYKDQLIFMKDELRLGMIINPEKATSDEIAEVISFPSAISVTNFVNRKVEVFEFRVYPHSEAVGRKLADLNPNILICAVERDGEIFIPFGEFVIHENDRVFVIGNKKDILHSLSIFGNKDFEIKSVIIIGGGRIAFYLAKTLIPLSIDVTIIENDPKIAAELSENLTKAMIIGGDGSDQHLLQQVGVGTADAFVALTGIDEENIISAMYAKHIGVPKVVAKINRLNYMDIAEITGLDCIVSPKDITTNQILQYVRAMQNTIGNKVDTLYKFRNGKAEILEFTAHESTRNLNVEFSRLNLKKNIIVATIVRGNRLIIPKGQDSIHNGDTVIAVTKGITLNDLNDIFDDTESV